MTSNVKIELQHEIKAFTSQINSIIIRHSIASKVTFNRINGNKFGCKRQINTTARYQLCSQRCSLAYYASSLWSCSSMRLVERRANADAVLVHHAWQLSSVVLMFNHALRAWRPYAKHHSVRRVPSSMVRLNRDVKNTMRPIPHLHCILILSSSWRSVSQRSSIRSYNLTLFAYLTTQFLWSFEFAQSSTVDALA